jgi:rubrerythrin
MRKGERMRLIDADALIAQWESDAEEMEELAIKLATYGAINDVKRQPTIEPRKKGEWITKSTNGEMFDSCSVCGYVEWDAPRNFCPCCGADMREGGTGWTT